MRAGMKTALAIAGAAVALPVVLVVLQLGAGYLIVAGIRRLLEVLR